MARLNIERQQKLEPSRLATAFSKLKELGLEPFHDGKKITFQFKGETVTYFAYSGWATGKTIKDGRGLDNLLKQLQ